MVRFSIRSSVVPLIQFASKIMDATHGKSVPFNLMFCKIRSIFKKAMYFVFAFSKIWVGAKG